MRFSITIAITLAYAPSIFAWTWPWSSSRSNTAHVDKLEKRAINIPYTLSVESTCGNSAQAQMLKHFNGVFFSDFLPSNGQGSDGPLAVKGRFKGHEYIVNQHGAPVCTSREAIEEDGLVVGGGFEGGTKVHVFGDTYLPIKSHIDQVQQEVKGCSVYNNGRLGGVSFNQMLADYNIIQVLYSLRSPTLVLDANHNLRRVRPATGGLDVITFDTCNGGCTSNKGDLSDPNGMLYGKNNWSGPRGMEFPENLIINIPVNNQGKKSSSITFSGKSISNGLKGCSTLWNVYPTSGSGSYKPGETLTVNRNTDGRLTGFFLAPLADIVDGRTGSFAGQVVGNNYLWASTGVPLHDYGSCSFSMCLPIIRVTRKTPVSPTAVTTDVVPVDTTDSSDSSDLPDDSSSEDSDSVTDSSSSDSDSLSESQSSSDDISSDSSQSSDNSESISSESSDSTDNTSMHMTQSSVSSSSDVSESSENSSESESLSSSESESESESESISSESSESSESSNDSITSDSSSSDNISTDSSDSSESSDSSSETVSSESSDSSDISESSSESISESESSSSESISESDSSSDSEIESSSSSDEPESSSSNDEKTTICTTEYHHHHHHHTEIDCDHGEEEHQHDVVYCEYDDHYHDDTENCEQDEEVVVCRDKDT